MEFLFNKLSQGITTCPYLKLKSNTNENANAMHLAGILDYVSPVCLYIFLSLNIINLIKMYNIRYNYQYNIKYLPKFKTNVDAKIEKNCSILTNPFMNSFTNSQYYLNCLDSILNINSIDRC